MCPKKLKNGMKAGNATFFGKLIKVFIIFDPGGKSRGCSVFNPKEICGDG